MTYPKLLLLLLVCAGFSICRSQTVVIDSLEKLAQRLPDDTVKAKTLYDLSFELSASNPGLAYDKTVELMELASRIHYPRGMAMAYDVQGNILRARGDYLEAVNKHFESIRIYDSIGFRPGYRTALVNLGSDYSYLKNYPKAIEYFRKALALTDTSDIKRQVIILNNIGNTFQALGWYDSAIAVYQKARPYADADATHQLSSFLYPSMAIVYAEKGDFENAIPLMLQGIGSQLAIGDKSHYASSASTLAGFYIEVKDYQKAGYYLDEAYKAAAEIQAKSVIANYYRNKAHLLYKTGKYNEAYQMLDKFILLNDSLINQQHVAQLAEAETRFGLENKNKELALVNAEKALKESELKRQSQWGWALAVITAIMLVAVFFMYRSIQLKKQANKHLQDTNALMQKENILAQYETLRNQVNPHFLFNSLNALSSLIKQNPEKAVEFTGVFSRLYRSVLELKDHAVITLSEELRLVDDFMYLQKIRFEDKLKLEKNIPAYLLEYFIPPFCIQMLIENAIKHNIISDEKNLLIKIVVQDDQLVISNTYQPRAQKQGSTGVGIKNIVARFKIIHNTEPQFFVTSDEYIAKIPLINPNE